MVRRAAPSLRARRFRRRQEQTWGSIASNDATGTTLNPSMSFGLTAETFSIGNYVSFDTNDNGQVDVGELGAAGVTVLLQTSAGTLAMLTDASGYYRFDGLPARDLHPGHRSGELPAGRGAQEILDEATRPRRSRRSRAISAITG